MPAYTKPPGNGKPSRPYALDALIGRKIQSRRLQLGLTLDDLAKTIGTHRQSVSAYEQGTLRIPVWRLWQIAKALDCSIIWFFQGLEIGGEHDA